MFKSKKVGGIRFLTIGRLNVSYSVKRKAQKEARGIYTLSDTGLADAGIAIVLASATLFVLFT